MYKAMMVDYFENTMKFWEFGVQRFHSEEEATEFFTRRRFIKDLKGGCDLISYTEGKRDLGVKIVKVQ